MSFLPRKALPRRAVLRGAGAALALPLLDAMTPALTAVENTPAAPRQAAAARLRLHADGLRPRRLAARHDRHRPPAGRRWGICRPPCNRWKR